MLRYLTLPALFLGMCLLGGLIVSQEHAPHSPPHMAVTLNDIFR
ncbi:hypothetical protein [Pseudomonas sp. GOM6]|nr:hypothetical protein [Pseudomonas sp. GOM6]MDG1581570.1 hypothetical protein [Pseudomonas sp. GOM6]